jgi:hypothetical protein
VLLFDKVEWSSNATIRNIAMPKIIVERQDLVEVVNALPDEVLIELAHFLDYLRYRTSQHRKSDIPSQNFLLSVAGLGKSEQQDVSERDEEILRNEIDPLYGWSSKPSNLV